jgi:hypothetical protein|tara:strand:+ start:154 stop:342 length:189 start_codon:yes stop_codon:yes gene_type:complete
MENLGMIFGSNPSVYTLPGTWEAQPMIPIELAVATTVGLTSIAFIGMLIAGVSVFKTKRKRV